MTVIMIIIFLAFLIILHSKQKKKSNPLNLNSKIGPINLNSIYLKLLFIFKDNILIIFILIFIFTLQMRQNVSGFLSLNKKCR